MQSRQRMGGAKKIHTACIERIWFWESEQHGMYVSTRTGRNNSRAQVTMTNDFP